MAKNKKKNKNSNITKSEDSISMAITCPEDIAKFAAIAEEYARQARIDKNSNKKKKI